MKSPKGEDAAEAYQIRLDYLYELRRKHNLTAEDMAEPDLVFNRLLESGNRSPLRTRLADPAERERIKLSLMPK